jgi:hypothetical protein
MSQCHWNNLTNIDLGNVKIIETATKSEIMVASG